MGVMKGWRRHLETVEKMGVGSQLKMCVHGKTILLPQHGCDVFLLFSMGGNRVRKKVTRHSSKLIYALTRAANSSTPILPSPSLSPADRKALVSLSVSALAPAEKFCRKSFSSSSSMKPLLSWSMTPKAFLTSSADLPARPHALKNFL